MATTWGDDIVNSNTPPGSPPGTTHPTKFDPRNPEQLYKPLYPFITDPFVPCEDHKDAIKWLNDPKKHLLYALSQETSSRGKGKHKHKIYSVQLRCSHSRKYEDSSKGKNKHGSRMINCPFRANLKPHTKEDYEKGWLLTVTNPLHNHSAIRNPLGVPHFRKLDE
jgi:hypothetical protein